MRLDWQRWSAVTEPGSRVTLSLLAIILLAAALTLTLQASVKAFWFDEVFTAVISQTDGPNSIWHALEHAVDGNPPLYYFVNQVASRFISNEHLALRLPSILGVMLAIVCIYAFLGRRGSHLSALVGAVFLLTTQAATYATEARPYGMLLGCVAASILAWQLADESRLCQALLAATLAASISMHYYAILIWPAFVLAEMAVFWFDRRFRPGVWAAIAIGLAPLLLFGPLLLNFRSHYGTNFWARPGISHLITSPSFLFNLGKYWGLLFTIGMTAVFGVFADGTTFRRREPGDRTAEPNSFSGGECVLALTFLWLPAYAVIAAKIGHGALTDRYTMPAVLGGALVVGYLAGKVPSPWKVLALILICGYFGLSSLDTFSRIPARQRWEAPTTAGAQLLALADGLHQDGLPIVVSNGLEYLPMVYYSRHESTQRLYALVDPTEAIRYAGSDSVDLALLSIQPYLPLNLLEFKSFRTQHREFLLVCETGARFEWWSERLLQEGHALQLLSQSGANRIFKVTLKP